MTEQEWVASADPAAMLEWVLVRTGQRPSSTKHVERMRLSRGGSDRKLRLFACAAFRASGCGVWINDAPWALAMAENHADGLITDDELRKAHEHFPTALVARHLLCPSASNAAMNLVLHCFPGSHADAKGEADSLEVAYLLREIVGNPFRPVTLSRRCVTCNGTGRGTWKHVSGSKGMCHTCDGRGWMPVRVTPTVLSLATAAYEHRTQHGHLDHVRLAVLADALEEAGYPPCPLSCPGCGGTGRVRQEHPWGDTYATEILTCDICRGVGKIPSYLLSHLRSPGPHVRGCWALDVVREA